MSDAKDHQEQDERELALDPETVQDLEPGHEDAEDVVGGAFPTLRNCTVFGGCG